MTDALVIGAGPTGLTAAAHVARLGFEARVVDRDEGPGGVPRHSDHPGYGLLDLHRLLSGPAYARRLTDRATNAGARIDVRTTVTGVRPMTGGGAEVDLTSPAGRETIAARAVLLATGCRERPRPARLVPGSRPPGVLTTGWLQRLVHLQHGSPGRRAVVVGAEHVSFSAVVTLADAGCRTVAMVTEGESHTSFAAFDFAARARYRFPLLTRARVAAIHGTAQVTGVTLERSDGRRAHVECDTVIFTGDWYPENELAVGAGLLRHARTHAPSVDTRFRTREPGILAAGNLVHPASTAQACARDGERAAEAIAEWLTGAPWPTAWTAIETEPPLLWSSPDIVVPGQPGPLRAQTAVPLDAPRLEMLQGPNVLWSGRLPWIRPDRPFAIPGEGLARATAGPPIVLRVR